MTNEQKRALERQLWNIVDRADLDYQTTTEFNHFSPNSVDGTDNTRKHVQQLADDTNLIVTTIQKLNTAISRDRFQKRIGHLRDKRDDDVGDI